VTVQAHLYLPAVADFVAHYGGRSNNLREEELHAAIQTCHHAALHAIGPNPAPARIRTHLGEPKAEVLALYKGIALQLEALVACTEKNLE